MWLGTLSVTARCNCLLCVICAHLGIEESIRAAYPAKLDERWNAYSKIAGAPEGRGAEGEKEQDAAVTLFAMARPPSKQVLDFLSGYDSSVGGLALALRKVLLEEAPEAVEKVYLNHPSAVWYGSGTRMRDMLCYIARAKDHVNLGFCRGATLSDPDRVLKGTGKVMRHVKFRNEPDISRPFVRRYIREAMNQGRQPNATPRRSRKKS
jgi:hypothetical protein